jgi:tight adherence protein C
MTPTMIPIVFEWYIILAIALCWALAFAGFGWYCAHAMRQISYVTLADGRRQERQLPIAFRLLLPFAPNFRPAFAKAFFAKGLAKAARNITSAGYEGLMSAEDFFGLRVVFPLLFGPLWGLFVSTAVKLGHVEFLTTIQPLLIAAGLLWFFIYPTLWLKQAIRLRHGEVRKALPFVLDLLTLSVEAGMDFMSALQRNAEKRKIDAFGEELIRVVREIQLGKTRRDALRDMSVRVNLPDLQSVVNALVQADELGVSIGAILRIQADQMRQRRFERAEKLANEAPVKMLFPLMVFIFPSVFLILLGPIIARMVQQGF